MRIEIDVRDYNSEYDIESDSWCSNSYIHYNIGGPNHDVHVTEPDHDGDGYLSVNDFGWWIGCQHAIKFTWPNGEEVILKASSNVKLKRDKETQKKILEYFKMLIANDFKYMPFDEPERKLELSGAETEFMDI